MSFLTIPSQEGLFTMVKSAKSTEDADSKCPADEDDDDDDDDDDDTEDVRLIPRCSPVPRKRGASIYDETAEYMRIHSALIPAARRRVSFADTTGGDLVDVKEFIAFDSDEDDDERIDEEMKRYRKLQQEPSYRIDPEFILPTESVLKQSVIANKVEVEQLTAVEQEPLAFTVIVRVLNISFHKSVYIRSTMDNWATYFDYPAEYVQGSHDGTTDAFSLKMSFAPPYTTHGSRIEFVVRYETSDGDYWANNSHANYVVTLQLSYEDDLAPAHNDTQEVRGILKPPKACSFRMDSDYEEYQYGYEEVPGTSKSEPLRLINPEIDIETADTKSSPPLPPNQELSSSDGTLSTAMSPGEQSPCVSSEPSAHIADDGLSFLSHLCDPIRSNEPKPLSRLHCEFFHEISEKENNLPTLLPLILNPLQCTSVSDIQEQDHESFSLCEHMELQQNVMQDNKDPKPEVIDTVFTQNPLNIAINPLEDANQCKSIRIFPTEKQTMLDEADPGILYEQEETLEIESRHGKSISQAFVEKVHIPDILFPSTANTANVFLGEKYKENLINTNGAKEKVQSGLLTQVNKPSAITRCPLEDSGEPAEIYPPASTEDFEKRASMDAAFLERGAQVLQTKAESGIFKEVPPGEMEEQKHMSIQVQEQPSHTSSMLSVYPESKLHKDISSVPTPFYEGSTSEKPLDKGQFGREKISGLVKASCTWLPTIETHIDPAGDNRLSHSPASQPSGELSLDSVSLPLTSQGFKQDVVAGWGELLAELLEDSSRCGENSPVAESQVSLGAGNEAETSPTLKDNTTTTVHVREVSQNKTLNTIQAEKEEQVSPQLSLDTLRNRSNTLSEALNPQPLNPQSEYNMERNRIPSIVFLSGAILLYVVLQEPSALIFLGLFIVSLCF